MNKPLRVVVLHEGAELTSGDRDKVYGDPYVNMDLAGRLKQTFRNGSSRAIGPAEQEAIDMILTKISRMGCGKQEPHRDNYVDAATYSGIAYESAVKEWEIQERQAQFMVASKIDEGELARHINAEPGDIVRVDRDQDISDIARRFAPRPTAPAHARGPSDAATEQRRDKPA